MMYVVLYSRLLEIITTSPIYTLFTSHTLAVDFISLLYLANQKHRKALRSGGAQRLDRINLYGKNPILWKCKICIYTYATSYVVAIVIDIIAIVLSVTLL